MHCGLCVDFIPDSTGRSKKLYIVENCWKKQKIDGQQNNGTVKAKTEWANNFILKYRSIA